MKFGIWIVDESSEYFIKRYTKAQDKPCTPIEITFESQSALFYGFGAEIYKTSLKKCTCKDFTTQKQPCKHIYRLAMELGLLRRDLVPCISNVSPDLNAPSSIASFGPWKETADDNQLKRFSSARKCVCIKFNPEIVSGTFEGSKGEYESTLTDCACGDFTNRRQPCKHIYKLAQLSGVLKSDGTSGSQNVSVPIHLEADKIAEIREVIAKIKTYNARTLELIPPVIVRTCNGFDSFCENYDTVDMAVSDGFFASSPDDKSTYDALKATGQKRVVCMLESINFVFPEDLKLQKDKFKWCLAHSDEIGNLILSKRCYIRATNKLTKNAAEICDYLKFKFNIGETFNPISHYDYKTQNPPYNISDILDL